LKKRSLTLLTTMLLSQNCFSIGTETFGDALLILIPSLSYGTTLYLDDKEGENQFYKSFATNAGITYAVKYAVNRKRPNGKDYSFPSGHTSATFQSASFIHKRYGFKYAIPSYLGATFVGYSRVDAKAHYTSDVVAGAVLGTLSGFFFTSNYKGFQVHPISMNSGYGIGIKKSW